MANTVTVANLQADLSLNTGNFSNGVNQAAGATDSLTGAILKADLIKGVLQGVADFAGKVAGLVSDAVGNFAEYEQLVGGVETLFGDSADIVMDYAKNAFKTAGVDANEYMSTVTSFSASLLQGLGGDTKKAANYADRALRDMSDNVNKMGSNMADVQNAYKGFAKQNYTMLDNLKLGYGGTKEEMARLIEDASKLTAVQEELGITVDASSMSFDNIINAISVIQKAMEITGTTEKEAATTIEGSHKMMEASWQNLLTSMVTGGEWFDTCIDDFIESVKTYVDNLLPAIEGAMHGFAALIGALAPMLASELPGFVERVLPDFVNAVTDIINGVLTALPGLLEALKGVLPMVTKAINDLIPNLISFILESIPLVIDAGITLLTSLVSGMADNVKTVVPQLTQGLVDMVDQIIEIVQTGGADLASAGLAFLGKLAGSMVNAVPKVLLQIGQLVQDLTASISTAADSEEKSFTDTAIGILKHLVHYLSESIPYVIPFLTTAVSEFISQFASLAAENTTDLANAAIDILNSLVTSLGDAGTIEKVMTDITTAVMAIIDAIISVITNLDIVTFANACASIVTQLADGIVGAVGEITKKLPDLITKIVEWLTNPDNLTGLLSAALTIFGELVADVPAIIEALTVGLKDIVTGIYNYFKDNGDEILKGFKEGFSEIGTKMTEIWTDKIKPAFEDLGTKMKNWLTQFDWGKTLVDFVGKITGAFTDLWEKVKTAFEGEGGLGGKIRGFFSQFDWGATFLTFVQKIKTGITEKLDNIKSAFTGENGFIGKVKSWFSEFDLGTIISDFIQKIKDAIEGAWDSFKQWFQSKISGLFSGIPVPNWIKKLFGKGEGDAEDETTMDAEDEMLVDMPENMITLDYSNLEPIPEETLASYQALADAINAINDAIAGGGEGSAVGLNANLSGLPALMSGVLTAAKDLADFFAGGFVTAIATLLKHVCSTAINEEGNIDASGGNTLYTAWGVIYGLFVDIYATSQLLAQYWSTEFIAASELMRAEAGHATGTVQLLAGVAMAASFAFDQMAASIWSVIDAYVALNSFKNGGGGSKPTPIIAGAAAEGGPVIGGLTYLVGEKGPELFTPNRNGWIHTNDELMGSRGQDIYVNVNFNGEVIGDERSIRGYVTEAAHEAIEEAVYAAI
jgi:hypothetical protein